MIEVRVGVDAVDRELVALLKRRFGYMDAAARIKPERGHVRDDVRKAQVIANVRAHLGSWVMLLVVSILASFVGGLGAIACGIGLLFTSFYAYCVIGFALGQTIAQTGAASQPPSYGPPPTYQ